jgi:hypothetical protein
VPLSWSVRLDNKHVAVLTSPFYLRGIRSYLIVVCCDVPAEWDRSVFEFVMDEQLFFFAAFLFKAKQKAFPGRIIVFDLEVHDDADPGESVSKDPKQSADPGGRYA